VDDAFHRQLIALLPRLRRFGRGLTGSVDDGDDLVQAALERAMSRAHQWTPGTRLDSWMFRIMQTMHLNDLTASLRRGNSEVLDPDKETGGDLRDEVESRLMLDHVREQVALLPEEQKSVLLLVCIEGLSYKETANTLEVPIGTVMSRLARARLSLQRTLDKTHGAKVASNARLRSM